MRIKFLGKNLADPYIFYTKENFLIYLKSGESQEVPDEEAIRILNDFPDDFQQVRPKASEVEERMAEMGVRIEEEPEREHVEQEKPKKRPSAKKVTKKKGSQK